MSSSGHLIIPMATEPAHGIEICLGRDHDPVLLAVLLPLVPLRLALALVSYPLDLD